VVNESCPGSVETMKILKEAIEEVKEDAKMLNADYPEKVRSAKVFLREALNSIKGFGTTQHLHQSKRLIM